MTRAARDMPEVEWTSWLVEEAKPALQEIFFFNRRQNLYYDEIVAAVEQFGEPQIVHAEGGVTVVLPKLPEAQCLFAVDKPSKTANAVVLFTRHRHSELEVLHLATSRAWQSQANLALTTMLVIAKLKEIARSIRGIEKVRLPYGRGCLGVSC